MEIIGDGVEGEHTSGEEVTMQESARIQRNKDRLGECHPQFSARLNRVILALEAQDFRPRIQDAWRSKQDQLIAFQTHHSDVTFGFHNATGPNGEKMALAVDLLDDDNPLDSPVRYLLALAIAARDHGLTTGILWHRKGQPALVEAEAAIVARNIDEKVHVGWDPTHVEVVGVSLAEAQQGDFSKVV